MSTTRQLDHDVLDAAEFLRGVVLTSPDGATLELDVLVGDVAGLSLSKTSRFGHHTVVIDKASRESIADSLGNQADGLACTWLALRGPAAAETWFEAPHFGESEPPIVQFHEAFPRQLRERMIAAGTIRVNEYDASSNR